MNYKNYQIEIQKSQRAKFRALIDDVPAERAWASAEAALEYAREIVDKHRPARPEPDQRGYGAYQHGMWFTIKPVWGVGDKNYGYKYQLEGYRDEFPTGRGWYELDKAIRAAKRKIEKLIGPAIMGDYPRTK